MPVQGRPLFLRAVGSESAGSGVEDVVVEDMDVEEKEVLAGFKGVEDGVGSGSTAGMACPAVHISVRAGGTVSVTVKSKNWSGLAGKVHGDSPGV